MFLSLLVCVHGLCPSRGHGERCQRTQIRGQGLMYSLGPFLAMRVFIMYVFTKLVCVIAASNNALFTKSYLIEFSIIFILVIHCILLKRRSTLIEDGHNHNFHNDSSLSLE